MNNNNNKSMRCAITIGLSFCLLTVFGQSNSNREIPKTEIGDTWYDQQSGSGINRTVLNDDGTVGTVFTFSEKASPWPNRGTGYNYFDGTTWGSAPTARLESIRTGWPSYAVLANGMEISISHSWPGGRLIMMSRQKGSGSDWKQDTLSNTTGFSALWPNITSGGADGNSIHCLATNYRALVGEDSIYKGQKNAIIYRRSQDGGATWDIVDSILPGLDSNFFESGGSLNHSITSEGDNVAIAVWGGWRDCVLLKSTDNGTTWTKTLIIDFPIDFWDFKGIFDPDGDGIHDTIGVSTSSGDILLDNSGKVHAVYGMMQVYDDNADSLTYNYFPLKGKLHYWNESFGTDSSLIIGEVIDKDGSGELDWVTAGHNSIPKYSGGACSSGSIRKDVNGNLYVVYAAPVEDKNNGSEHFQHLFLTASRDGGNTWCEYPNDITPDLDDEVFEYAYPNVARGTIRDKIHVIAMLDYEPGTTFTNPADEAEENTVIHLVADLSDTCGVANVSIAELGNSHRISIYPNPTSVSTTVEFPCNQNDLVDVMVFNMLGAKVEASFKNSCSSGKTTLTLDTRSYQSGMYKVAVISKGQLFYTQFNVIK